MPTSRSKGVLVAPTVFGNVMLGPTAEDLDDRTRHLVLDRRVSHFLRAKGAAIMPALLDDEVTAIYVGLRAATEQADYQMRRAPEQATCVSAASGPPA